MKSCLTKEQAFKASGLPRIAQKAFFDGWYAAGNEVNQMEDSDALQENLKARDFLKPMDGGANE